MSISLPPSPDGFTTWLDYVVETYDFGSLRANYLFDENFDPLDTDALRSLVRAEYSALKARADTME